VSSALLPAPARARSVTAAISVSLRPVTSLLQTAPALEVRGVRKSYGLLRPKAALRGVSLTVERGECYGLAGQNGAGKTTLIRLLLGIAAPDGGEVRLLGERPDDPEVRRRVGFVPESAELPPSATPRQLVRRWARLRKLEPRAAQEQGLAALCRLGMEKLLDRPAGKLSKGERQRTLLALALLGTPELLVLDEPTDGIDPLGRALMRQLIREQCAAGRTVFLNSHLLAETERLCTRVGILHAGLLVREERPGLQAPGGLATSAIVLDRPASSAAAQAAKARVPPEGLLRDVQAGPGGEVLLVDHQGPRELNEAIDLLRKEGALLVEVRRLRPDLEAALAEVAGGQAEPAPDELPASAAGPVTAAPTLSAGEQLSTGELPPTIEPPPPPELAPPPLRPLRTLDATLRVAAEITSDLLARKVGWMALAFALLLVGTFLWTMHSQLVEGAAALGRTFASGGLVEQQTMTALVGGNAARTLYWGGLIGGVVLSSLFAPPLLDPRRTVLLYAQPVSRADFALGLIASVCGLGTACALFFAALLFGGLRALGLEVSPLLLLAPLPWLCSFAAAYAVVLLATYGVRHPILAAAAGLCFLLLCGVVHQAAGHEAEGAGEAFAAILRAGLPKLVELSDQAYRLGSGGKSDLFPFLSTLLPAAGLVLCLVVAARRSER
jgi:ABC-2 type transport system ATP-binding protein